MYKNIGGKGSGKKTPYNVCSIIMGVLIAISIILFIIGIVMFLQPPKKIKPLHNPVAPQPIKYNDEAVTCDNLNLISVKSYFNHNNITIYTIKSTPGAEYHNNAILLSSGKPIKGYYSCNANNSCYSYTFITSQKQNCTGYKKMLDFTKNQNCIGGRGCHPYNYAANTSGMLMKYNPNPITTVSSNL